MIWILLTALGVGAGILSGLFGIGGGVLIVLGLLLGLKFSIHEAMATSLVALLLPVGAPAVYEYWTSGRITKQHILYGLLIGAGLFVGAYFGAKIAISLDQQMMKRAFALFLVFIAAVTWWRA